MNEVTAPAQQSDPCISARYDRALNMIAIAVDGEDDIYLHRDEAFAFQDALTDSLREQAAVGGVA